MSHPWRLQHLRFSFFSTDMQPVSNSDALFAELTSVEPEVDEWRGGRTIRRRVAEVSGHRFELLEQPYRIDMTRAGMQNPDVAAAMGDIKEASLGGLGDLKSLSETWAPLSANVPNVVRMAIGGVVFLPTSSANDSYERLQEIFPTLDLDYSKTSDFTIQMNRFRDSVSNPGMRINRLSVWQPLALMLMSGPVPRQLPHGTHWLQASFDVNTAAENTESFTDAMRLALFEEQKGHFLELAESPL